MNIAFSRRLLMVVLVCVMVGWSAVAWGQWEPVPGAKTALPKERKLALLIGIPTFQNKLWAPLAYAKNDVAKMEYTLRKYGTFDRILIRDRAGTTTRKALLESLRQLRKHVKVALDTVVVYVSSHGTISSPPGSPTRKRYIITSDTTERISQTALSVEELQEILKTFRSRRIVLMLATCYTYRPQSKSVRNPGLKGAGAPTRSLKSRAMQILSAAAKAQPAFESSLLRSDVYTHYLADCAKKLFRTRKRSVTAIDLHVCALAPTREFVKKHKGTNQVPVVYTDRNANNDVVLFRPARSRLQVGYFRAKEHARGVYRVIRMGQKSQSKAKTATPGELMALSPGRYSIQLTDARGRVLQTQTLVVRPDHVTAWRSDWVAEAQGGILYSRKGGTAMLGGGMFGVRLPYFGLKLGVWTTQKQYLQSDPSQQLYFELRADAGGRWRWGMLALFAGAYAGLGVMFKHVAHPLQPAGAATVFLYGLTVAPTLWIREEWGITLQVDAGFSVMQLDTLTNIPDLSARAGLSYRF
jgi:hypothetical protein